MMAASHVMKPKSSYSAPMEVASNGRNVCSRSEIGQARDCHSWNRDVSSVFELCPSCVEREKSRS